MQIRRPTWVHISASNVVSPRKTDEWRIAEQIT